MSATTSRAPSLANSFAEARPMPEPAPVITTTRSFSLMPPSSARSSPAGRWMASVRTRLRVELHERFLPARRLRVECGADFDRKLLPGLEPPAGLPPHGLGQVHRIARPGFDDHVVVAAPAAVDEPHPEIGTEVGGKLEQKPRSRFAVLDRVPARLEVGGVVAAANPGVEALHAAHVRAPGGGIECRPGLTLAGRPEACVRSLPDNPRPGRDAQDHMGTGLEPRMRSPEEGERQRPEVRDLVLHVDAGRAARQRSEEHTSELQSRLHLVCRLLLEKKKKRLTYHQSARRS